MDALNKELADDPSILIFGINAIGKESGNEFVTNERDTPWLQDVEGVEAWDLWGVGYRDVYILNGEQVWVEQVNLTDTDLTETNNYEAFKELLQSID